MGRKSKKEVRSLEILECCYRVIQGQGLEKTTIKSIAQEMKVAPSLIMHYFKTKDDLIASLVDFMVEKMDVIYLPTLETLPSAKEKLQFFLDETLNLYVAQAVEDKVFYACFYLSLHKPSIRDRFIKMYERDKKVSNIIIQDYLKEEGLPPVDPEIVSVHLITLIEGLNFYYAIYRDREKLKPLLGLVKNNFLALLHSYSALTEGMVREKKLNIKDGGII